MHDDADEIRRQMAALRSRGEANVAQFSHAIDRVTDWREHYKAHPWAAVAVAAATGYFLAPRRQSKPVHHSGAQSLNNGNASTVAEKVAPATATAAVGGVITTFLMRFVKDYVTNTVKSHVQQRLQQQLQHRSAPPDSSQHPFGGRYS